MSTPEAVAHPSHYASGATCDACKAPIECITIIRHANLNIGTAQKYLWRQGKKADNAAVQDINKAIFYLADEIHRLGGEVNEKLLAEILDKQKTKRDTAT